MRRSDRIGAARRAACPPWGRRRRNERRRGEGRRSLVSRHLSPVCDGGALTMALHHCRPGETARLGAIDDPAIATAALARTPSFEAIHLVVRAGDSIPSHRVAGSMTLYCIAGHIRLGGDVPVELRAGDWLFLEPGTTHAEIGRASRRERACQYE